MKMWANNIQKLTFILFLFPFLSYASQITDDAENSLAFTKPAQRVISLAPDITEILFAIGASSQVVGVISGSDYPEDAKKKPQVGSYSGIDLERVISLHPDLIVVWGNTFAREMSVFKKMGIRIYVRKPRHLLNVPHTMKNLGILTGHLEQANQSAEIFINHLNTLKQQYQHRAPVRVFYQIGAYNLFTINKDSWINQAIELCGGQNIFADALSAAPQVSWEAIIAAQPNIIISDSKNPDWQKRWQRFSDIPAVKAKHMCMVSPDWTDRAGPRLIRGVKQLCECIDKARQP